MATYNIEDIGGEAKPRHYKKLKDVNLDCCPYQIENILNFCTELSKTVFP